MLIHVPALPLTLCTHEHKTATSWDWTRVHHWMNLTNAFFFGEDPLFKYKFSVKA